jgi:flagellar basal-body rod modification protein FlgD
MAIDATSSVSSQSTASDTTAAAASANSLDYDSFLQLLIAQMKNQDPTKPTDPAQLVAQLASFSSVEQAIKTNSKLDSLMTSMALSQAEGIIGRTVVSDDGTIAGTVVGMRVISGGAVAILEDGRELPLGAGVTVM